MKTQPRHLKFVAGMLVGITVGLPLQVAVLYGHNPLAPVEWMAIGTNLAPLNWVIMFLAPLTAWMVHRASSHLVVVAPLLVTAVVQNNWFVAEAGTDYAPLAVGAGTGLFLLAMGTLLNKPIRELVLNPAKRWWLTPVRKKASLPVRVRTDRDDDMYLTTFDVSETGAFLSMGWGNALKVLDKGRRCKIVLNLGQQPIECEAEVVRTASPTGKYPAGVGVRFLGLESKAKKVIRQYVASSTTATA